MSEQDWPWPVMMSEQKLLIKQLAESHADNAALKIHIKQLEADIVDEKDMYGDLMFKCDEAEQDVIYLKKKVAELEARLSWAIQLTDDNNMPPWSDRLNAEIDKALGDSK